MGHHGIHRVNRVDSDFDGRRNRVDLRYFLLCVLDLSLNRFGIARYLMESSRHPIYELICTHHRCGDNVPSIVLHGSIAGIRSKYMFNGQSFGKGGCSSLSVTMCCVKVDHK